MPIDIGNALPANPFGATAAAAGAPGGGDHDSFDTYHAARTTSQGGKAVCQARQFGRAAATADPRVSLPLKRRPADPSITSLGKSVDDLPPLPCGLP
jgi:hypothetical protein